MHARINYICMQYVYRSSSYTACYSTYVLSLASIILYTACMRSILSIIHYDWLRVWALGRGYSIPPTRPPWQIGDKHNKVIGPKPVARSCTGSTSIPLIYCHIHDLLLMSKQLYRICASFWCLFGRTFASLFCMVTHDLAYSGVGLMVRVLGSGCLGS